VRSAIAALVVDAATRSPPVLSATELAFLEELMKEHPLALPRAFAILSLRVYADEPVVRERSAVGQYDFVTKHADGAAWTVHAACQGFQVASGHAIFLQDLEVDDRCTLLLTSLSVDNIAMLATSLFEHLRNVALSWRPHANLLMLVQDETDACTAERLHFSSSRRIDEQSIALRILDASLVPDGARVLGTHVVKIA
jgi:hypothetical protein